MSAGSKRSSAEAEDGAEGELQKRPRLDNGAAAPLDGAGPAGQEGEGAASAASGAAAAAAQGDGVESAQAMESAVAAQGGSVESSRAMASGEVMEAEAAVKVAHS